MLGQNVEGRESTVQRMLQLGCEIGNHTWDHPDNITGIQACQKVMPGVPMVGVFDTAFHQTMPPRAFMYAIPYEYYEKDHVRRYGFHGTSHLYVSRRAADMLGRPLKS